MMKELFSRYVDCMMNKLIAVKIFRDSSVTDTEDRREVCKEVNSCFMTTNKFL